MHICVAFRADDASIREAVEAWLANATAATATYGPINLWDTSGVTDMSLLFCAHEWEGPRCNSAAASFDDDITPWDTSGVTMMDRMFIGASAFNQMIGDWRVDEVVTSMSQMFRYASSFNQPLGDWNVDKVTNMQYMLSDASDFDQDLGWCMAAGVTVINMFYGAKCSPASPHTPSATAVCGVTKSCSCP